MTYKKKAIPRPTRADKRVLPERYRTSCAGCDAYATCTNVNGAWLCDVCKAETLTR